MNGVNFGFGANVGGSIGPINGRVTVLENNENKYAYFTTITTAAGTITIPSQAQILLDQFESGIDAYVSTLSGGQPTGQFPVTAGGTTVDVLSFDALGNFVLTSIPDSYPIALIYVLKIKAKYQSNLNINNIIGETVNLMNVGNISFEYPFFASTSVVIPGTTHAFGRLPEVAVYDSTGQERIPRVDINPTNFDVTVTFNTPITGTILLT